MTKSKLFVVGCAAFVVGIGIASFVNFSQIVSLAVFVLGIFIVTVFWRNKKIAVIGAVLLCCMFGVLRYEMAEEKRFESEYAMQSSLDKNVRFQAKVAKDPEQRNLRTQTIVEPDFFMGGRVLLTIKEPIQIAYADKIEVSGVLQKPKAFDDFNYADFLAKDGIYGVMYDAKVKVIEQGSYEHAAEVTMGGILFMRGKLREIIQTHLSSTGSGIMAAILLGDKSFLTEDMKEQLNRVGLRHITAISGMHVAILMIYTMSFLLLIGLWRQQAFYITIIGIVIFIVLTGIQPSALRAGIMGSMILLAQHVGRRNLAWRSLIFAATVMLAVNPFLLAKDVGFQLSFLAVLGVILFLSMIVSIIPKRLPAKEIMGMSIAAQILTLPILIFNFGQFSIVSIFANIFVVPLLPFLMGFGFLFLMAGLIGPHIGFLFSLPVSVGIEYIKFVISLFARVPFAAVRTENLSFFWIVLLYAFITVAYWKFRKRKEFLLQ